MKRFQEAQSWSAYEKNQLLQQGFNPSQGLSKYKVEFIRVWMSFQSWQSICPTLFLFNQIKRKVISYKAYSKELGKIYVISKPQINLILR